MFPGPSYVGELPNEDIRYGAWEINKRNSGSIIIKAYSPTKSTMWINCYSDTRGWTGWEHCVTSSDLEIVIKNSGTVAAVANADVQIVTITLPANHKYLILAHTNTNRGDNNSIINCSIKKISGTVSSSFGMEDARTTMSSGGGCTAWGIVDTATSCVYGVYGYGYSSMDYNYIGKICAIQLA